jgi:hypothetical protein
MGDLNSDGFADLAVGFPGLSSGNNVGGGFRVFTGSSSGYSTTPAWSIDGDFNVANLGRTITFNGDFNGDGLAGITTSAGPGSSGTHSIASISDFRSLSLLPRAMRPGTNTPIGVGGKSPSRAFDASVLARTSAGSARVKLQVEVKARGTAFSGTGLQTSATWTATTIPASALTLPITGLAANTAYHWRARLLYDPAAAFPASHSRWYYGSSDINGIHFRTP